jgi:hypothetical protein
MKKIVILTTVLAFVGASLVNAAELPTRPASSDPVASAKAGYPTIPGVAAEELAPPSIPKFTVRQPFQSANDDEALAVSRCIYSSDHGPEVEFALRIFASSERATRSLTKAVESHLKQGGSIISREFGKSARGEYLEVARCTRNGVEWTHWVVGDKSFAVASRERAHLDAFLATHPAWEASPRVLWESPRRTAWRQIGKGGKGTPSRRLAVTNSWVVASVSGSSHS